MSGSPRSASRASGRVRTELRRCLIALAWLAGGVFVLRLAALLPQVVETLYGRWLYPRIAPFIGIPAHAWSVSLVQLIAFLLVVGLAGGLIRAIRRAIRRRSWTAGFGPPHRTIALLAVIVWVFQIAWGLNYARPSLARRLKLREVAAEPANLAPLVRTLAHEVNASYRLAIEARQYESSATAAPDSAPAGLGVEAAGSRSPVTLRIDRRVVADRLTAGYVWLIPAFQSRPLPPPKHPRPLGWVLTRLGISGFYFPITAEATVNAALPHALVPFVAAHEMAHQRGIAPEDEANFMAYLACRESGLAAARYSGSLGAFGLAWNALARFAPDSARAIGPGVLDAGPRADRSRIREFWARHEGPAFQAMDRVNDAYLRANAQRGGVASYGRAVDLLLAYAAAGRLEADE